MGLCMKFLFGGGDLVINGCPQSWIDANIRILDPDAPTPGNAAPGSQGLDAIYWGGQYAREVWKVPDNCRVTLTCDGEGGVTVETCTTIVGAWAGYVLQRFPPGAPLPPTWPANNW